MVMGSKPGGEGLRTVECLRGRLLAERVASKVAEAEAELMAKRVAELESQLAEEMKWMKRAERRMRYALKKLEPLKLSESSSSSSACSSGRRRSEDRELNSETVESGQCGYTCESVTAVGNKLVSMKPVTGQRDNPQAPVPAILSPSSNTYKTDIKSDVHGVLIALRHVREQLCDSTGIRGDVCSHKMLHRRR